MAAVTSDSLASNSTAAVAPVRPIDQPTRSTLAAGAQKNLADLRSSYGALQQRMKDDAAVAKEATRVGTSMQEIRRIWGGDLGRMGDRIREAESSANKAEQFDRDLDVGMARGRELIGDESLGRLSTRVGAVDTRLDEGQSADTKDILERRRKALAGLTPEEMSAQRGQAAEQFGRNEETNRRRLAAAQARLGARGDTAATQQSALLSAGQQQRTNFERDMILQNRQIQDAALNAFEGSVRGAEQQQQAAKLGNIQVEQFNLGQQMKQRELEKFNLQQAARERFGQIGVAFGMAQMGSAERSGDKAAAAQYAAALAQSSGGK